MLAVDLATAERATEAGHRSGPPKRAIGTGHRNGPRDRGRHPWCAAPGAADETAATPLDRAGETAEFHLSCGQLDRQALAALLSDISTCGRTLSVLRSSAERNRQAWTLSRETHVYCGLSLLLA